MRSLNLDTYTVRELEARPIKELEVFYTGQSFENDVLTIRRGSFGEKDVFILQKEDKVVLILTKPESEIRQFGKDEKIAALIRKKYASQGRLPGMWTINLLYEENIWKKLRL